MRSVAVRRIAETDLRDVIDTVAGSGVVAIVSWEPLRDPEPQALAAQVARLKARRTLCLDAVGDPGTVGTLIRTAAAFGVEAVLLGSGTVDPTNPKVVRASAGTLFHLPLIVEGVELAPALSELAHMAWTVLVARPEAVEAISSIDAAPPWALVLGSEAHGVSDDLQRIGRSVAVPMPGAAESLNVAVAGGILLHALAGSDQPG